VWPPQEGTVATYGETGTSAAEQLLRAKMANTIVLPEGVLTVENKDDRATVSRIKGFGLNLVALLRDTLYQLQDGITIELWAREGHVMQAMSEKKINIE